MADSTEILDKARDFITELFAESLDEKYVYHNLQHTQSVVDASIEIGEGSNLSDSDLQLLVLAAWFHDAGYVHGFKDHETSGVKIMETKLSDWGIAATDIATIAAAINDTRMPPKPQSVLGHMLCDADMNHLGRDNYFELAGKLRQEWEVSNDKAFGDGEWLLLTRHFISQHEYHTEYAKMVFGAVKESNLQKLNIMLEENEEPAVPQAQEAAAPKKKKGKKGGKDKEMRPDRGIETMFRVTLKNHIQLSQIADNKANIMLSINAIIISIVISALVPKIDSNPELLIPMIIMLAVCSISIVFATISTIPKVTHNDTSRADIAAKKTNLLFFGNFHSMTLEDYTWGMHEVMADREYLYGSMIKDLYFLGKVLHKKYKYLRITYGVFMTGIILSVISFIGVFAGWFGEWGPV